MADKIVVQRIVDGCPQVDLRIVSNTIEDFDNLIDPIKPTILRKVGWYYQLTGVISFHMPVTWSKTNLHEPPDQFVTEEFYKQLQKL